MFHALAQTAAALVMLIAVRTVRPGHTLPGAFLTISHSVDSVLIRPGETAVFTIHVANEGDAPAVQLRIDNPLPAVFQVISVQSSRGTALVQGQRVTLSLNTLEPGESVTLNIDVGVRETVKPPVDTLNNATLTYSGGLPRNAGVALRITAGTLPATGERPDEPDFSLLWTGALLALLGGLTIFLRDWRQRTCRS
jgi:uncharacterized repeat protein (TIGR01451 family)